MSQLGNAQKKNSDLGLLDDPFGDYIQKAEIVDFYVYYYSLLGGRKFINKCQYLKRFTPEQWIEGRNAFIKVSDAIRHKSSYTDREWKYFRRLDRRIVNKYIGIRQNKKL